MAIIQQVEDGKLVDQTGSATSSKTTAKAGGELDKEAFLQLLVAQMQYQDPLEPTDNTEYISQLATFSQLEETQNLNQTMTEDAAYNLVGKQVIMKVTNSQTGETSYASGMVDYVLRQNGGVYLSINDSLYSIEDLDTVADGDYYTASILAKTFSDEVAALPSVDQLTLSDEAKLSELGSVYSNMTDYQKSFLSEDTVNRFSELVNKMAELRKEHPVEGGGDSSQDTTEETS